jgi:hypothetical protein
MVRAQDFTSLTLKKWLTPKESSYFPLVGKIPLNLKSE